MVEEIFNLGRRHFLSFYFFLQVAKERIFLQISPDNVIYIHFS